MIKLDKIDKGILNLIQTNAKLNTKEIADKIGLSISPTYERIKKLENMGVIDKYIAIVNPEKIGKKITVYSQISLAQHSRKLIDNFKQKIDEIDEVMSCMHVSGNYDFLLTVMVDNMEDYQNFVINKLSIIEGISNVQSSFVIDQLKSKTNFSF